MTATTTGSPQWSLAPRAAVPNMRSLSDRRNVTSLILTVLLWIMALIAAIPLCLCSTC
jgi:hypothetical protein